MAFAVMNTVSVTAETLPSALADVQRLELDHYEDQPGFRRVSVFVSEDQTSVVTLAEWDSRDDFMAFRQTEIGRQAVETALPWHPHIAFFEVVASLAR